MRLRSRPSESCPAKRCGQTCIEGACSHLWEQRSDAKTSFGKTLTASPARALSSFCEPNRLIGEPGERYEDVHRSADDLRTPNLPIPTVWVSHLLDPQGPVRSTLASAHELVNTHAVTEGTNRGRRNSMRVACGLQVEVCSSPEPVNAEVMNISQKGLFLRPKTATPKDALQLSTSLGADRPLFLVLQFRGEKTPTRARSRVAWKSDSGVGLLFDDAPERLRDFISDLQDQDSTAAILSQVESGHVEFG